MPIYNESLTSDAPASLDTQYCFVPNEDGSFSSASKNNTFMGSLGNKFDEDWIIIELQAGKEYKFKLEGAPVTDVTLEVEDPILKLLDSKGGLVVMNDDKDAEMGKLYSELKITPEEDGKFYLSVSAYTGNPGQVNQGGYHLTVTERPAGPGDIIGTNAAEKFVGTDQGEKILGEGGNDVLDGGGGDDEIDGGDGDDLITGGPGADTIDGGDGNDTISYMHSGSGEMININLRAGSASGGDAAGDTLGDDIENVIGAAYAENMLTGDKEGNTLRGGSLSDVLVGDRGNDVLSGGGGDDELDGSDGDDTLNGGPGADELTGGDGDDTASYATSMMGVTVRLHSQQAKGGDAEGDTWGDTETVEYTLEDEDGENEDFEETVPDIINVTGSMLADTLAGDSRDNVLYGLGGDDAIYGGPGGGNDVLWGGGGADRLFGGLGGDTLHGGAGDDLLSGGKGADKVYGGAGSDMIYADEEDSVIDGWHHDDDPGRPMDLVSTMGAGEVESLEDVSDPFSVDTVSFEKSKTGIAVGPNGIFDTGDDMPFTLSDEGVVNIENIIGSSLNDAFTGDMYDNEIEGGDGADTLDGGEHASRAPLVFPSIGDTVSYRNSDRDVTVSLGNGAEAGVAIGGHAQGDTIVNFENVRGSAHGDVLTGSDDGATADDGNGHNRIWGMDGEDEIDGGEGSDVIEGGAGADELDGGTNGAEDDGQEGTTTIGGATVQVGDTLSYASSDAGVSVNLTSSRVSGGHADGDEIEVNKDAYDHDDDEMLESGPNPDPTDRVAVSTFEHATGSDHDDRLTGDHRDNTLNGRAGDDTLRGFKGTDTLIGGPGADSLDGGEEEDEEDDMVPNPDADLIADNGDETILTPHMDTASYLTAAAGVTVDLNLGRGTGGDAMGDSYRNIERFAGSFNDDTFIASEDIDRIDAGAHNADNKVNLRSDGDTISYEESEEAVTVSVNLADGTVDVVTGNVNDGDTDINYAMGDELTNFENVTGSGKGDTLSTTGQATDNMTGSTLMGLGGNDTLTGGLVNDVLMGGKGRDTLDGGAGNDRLVGGAGDDVMTGGDDAAVDGGVDPGDVFVFSPQDAGGVDIIKDFNIEEGDQLDFSALGIEDIEELAGKIDIHDGDVRIDLNDFGGGTIILETGTAGGGGFSTPGDQDAENALLELFDIAPAGADDMIDMLNVVSDANPGGIFIV